ncbi:hypothetical protein [Phenylobacterium sp.]|jgi:hypothetical protein|uniref:terminase small subunit-like protein n=1 Tax=Phenylobacterium sp. TaxID=1871053 RepID=UPI002F942713
MGDEGGGPALPGPGRAHVRWSEAVGAEICRRLRDGELLRHICEEPGMPSDTAVRKWARARPGFDRALKAARRAGWRPEGRLPRGGGRDGPAFGYCPEIGDEVFERLCEGESLTRIAEDPTLPSLSTFYYWMKRIPEFNAAVVEARRIQADRFCDLGWDLAEGASPETAYLTDVRLKQLRWMAGVRSPKVYRIKPTEGELARETTTFLIRHFKGEPDPVTGELRVVAYCPNPETGQMEREDTPGYRYPAGCVTVPGGTSWEAIQARKAAEAAREAAGREAAQRRGLDDNEWI